ncbi:MAG: Ribose transport system permease protein RbsC [Chloroflexi bacterium ADurb.Bin180]|jgi:ribose transport system permease protein|nr:MAG: Ribose transport system permease protein RbsC [Chloroflexi bacterium ADurb.Bin180]
MEKTMPARIEARPLLADFVTRFSRLFMLALLCVFMAFVAPEFFRAANLLNVLRSASLLAILAIGQTIIVLTGGIDLSMGTVATLAAIMTAWLLDRAHVPVPLAMAAGLAVGAFSGSANGLMRAYIGLPTFVATYGTQWMAIGFAVVMLGGYNIYGFERSFRFFGIGRVAGIPVPIFLLVIVWLLTWFILNRTTFGRRLYATGANREAARLSGIDTRRVLMQAHILSGLYAGFSGILMASLLNSGEAGMSDQQLLPAIAAVVVGGASLRGGQGGIFGTVIGALIMTLIGNAMNLMGLSSNWQSVVQGLVILGAVLLDQWSRRLIGQE